MAYSASSPYTGRFAPSPTGPLHFGSLVAAVGSWLDARHHGGRWAVRIDDVDTGRAVAGADGTILRTLERHGLAWDGPVVYQSRRGEAYAAALQRLIDGGAAFACGCTRREILATGRPGPAGVVYPGTCRNGLPAGRRARAWRLRAPAAPVTFADRRLGPHTVSIAENIGDFILRRGDGLFAYHLAMVVDDGELGVTDVVRGADLLIATAPQVALREALGLAPPRHLHLPLALNHDRRKLSKQTRAAPVPDDRPASTLAEVLAFLGLPRPREPQPAPVAEQLARALAHWTPARLPADDLTVA